MLNGTVVDSMLLPGAGHLPVYSLNPNTYLDLAVDELGLWAIYADPEYGGNLVMAKLDKGMSLNELCIQEQQGSWLVAFVWFYPQELWPLSIRGIHSVEAMTQKEPS